MKIQRKCQQRILDREKKHQELTEAVEFYEVMDSVSILEIPLHSETILDIILIHTEKLRYL